MYNQSDTQLGAEGAAVIPVGAHVYVIDDHSEVRKSLSMVLATVGITTWPFAASYDFLDQLADLSPAPILLDIRMPDLDGMSVLSRLAERMIPWPVIIMTAHGDIAIAVECMKRGAIEFLEKPFELEMVQTALGRAYALLADAQSKEQVRLLAKKRFAALTLREAQVLLSLFDGLQNKNVAVGLGLSVRTVEMHRAHAFTKLGVRSVVEAAELAHSAQWTEAEGE